MLPFQAEAWRYAQVVYGSYHLSESLQILLFTAVGFFLLIKKLAPEPTISIDLDWFYRFGGRGFQWLASKPIQGVDDGVSEGYRYLGLVPLMTVSRFWSWFDWHVIDGIVDGIAMGVRAVGKVGRGLQSGRLQNGLLYTASIVAVILIVYVMN
jgi:multicomponent Na+:H+ antiporter subunit D